jgi:general L-amino acid transport system substrate-binding protein
LKNAEICVQSGTTTEKNLNDYFRMQGAKIKPVVFEKLETALKAFFSGRCQAYTTDASALAFIRSKEAPRPDDYVVLPEMISKEPLGPVVRRGDDEWFAIVKWVVFALIEAEERGVTQANLEQMKAGNDPAIQRLLGSAEDSGKALGLEREWAARALKAGGNYGEIFQRNVGADSPLKLPRGLNALWTKGGLIYAPPIR